MQLNAIVNRTIIVPADLDTTWRLVSDIPRSVSHFSGIERFEQNGVATWTWTLNKVGAGKLSLQTIYSCTYSSDRPTLRVTWIAANSPGDNSQVEGHWHLAKTPKGTQLDLYNKLSLNVDLPRLMKRPAEAFVIRENGALIDRYIANLAITLQGGQGAVQ